MKRSNVTKDVCVVGKKNHEDGAIELETVFKVNRFGSDHTVNIIGKFGKPWFVRIYCGGWIIYHSADTCKAALNWAEKEFGEVKA